MLTESQQAEVAALQQAVEAHDRIALKLNWDCLRRTDRTDPDFLRYQDGRLIGFLGVYGFGSKVELCGMVHPDVRRQGHFQALYDEAMAYCRQAGFTEILLNTPTASPAGQAFLRQQGARYAFTEHQMKWAGAALPAAAPGLLRPATAADAETQIRLDIEAFGMSEPDARNVYSQVLQEADTTVYMIMHEGTTVGRMRVQRTGSEAWIYGFAVSPRVQGRGIGRRALEAVVAEFASRGCDVFLEVEAENARALHLYTSVGFAVVQGQDYYTPGAGD